MSSGSHASRQARPRRVLPLAVLLLVVGLLAIGVAWQGVPDPVASRLTGSEEPTCSVTTHRVAVAPRLEQVVREALDELGDGSCMRFDVEAKGERAVVDAVFYGGAVPDLWIPDGDWSLDKLPVEIVTPSLASTPVVLVGGTRARRPASWTEALTGGQVALPDPLRDSVGTLAMLAPRQEAQEAGADVEAARGFLVPTAQAYGEVASEGRQMDLSMRTLTAGTSRVVATTEEEYLSTRFANNALRLMVPRTGSVLLRFPLAVSADATSATREVAQRLVDWFGSDDGIREVRNAGFRPGDGDRQGEGVGLGRVRYLPEPAGKDIDDYRFTWQVMSVPSSVLAVIDVSGSMDYAAGSGRRIDVATGAARVALDLFPGHARVGLWAFSIDQGGPGQDWRVLEPLRRLDTFVDGVPQRDRLRSWASRMGTLTNGGTGLYDTALASYRRALKAYDPDYANSVILMTDGANDDPGSISGTQALRRLRALRDPDRPVRIVGIAISDDADLAALRRIAEATGGRAHRADRPEDILRVFTQEIANR